MTTVQSYRGGSNGGRFDFDDGGTYCGGWEDGKAHGHGVCTGPKSQGEYSGAWHYGFEVSGIYTWPSGSSYEGQWQNGKRHGLGVETRGRWIYKGEWAQGLKGRYGVRQSITSGAKYEGTWANGLQDGYGSETYADGGTYQGQWMRGMRHGYGVRSSAPFGLASHYRPKNLRSSMSSLRSEHGETANERDRRVDDCRGGFVLKTRSTEPPQRRRSLVEKSGEFKKSILQGLRIKKQKSTGDIDKRGTAWSVRSTTSNMSSASSEESNHSGVTHDSGHTDSNTSFVSQDDVTDTNVIETFMGEWKNDKRCGFGIAERSDGLRYEGEWYNNRKYGYGVTTFKDGTREEGKYKNNVLVTSGKKRHLFLLRSSKFREKINSAVNAAIRGSQIALQKADIAISRTATARGKSEQAEIGSMHAKEDSDIARIVAKQWAPEFHQPGIELLRLKLVDSRDSPDFAKYLLPRREEPPHHRSRSLYITAGKEAVTASRENLVYPSDYGEVEAGSPRRPSNEGSRNFLDPNTVANLRRLSAASILAAQNQTDGSPHFQHNASTRGPRVDYSFQQAISDHFDQYDRPPSRAKTPTKRRQDFSGTPLVPLTQVYAYAPDCTPDSGVSESMDNEDMSPTRPPRRSTLPTVLNAENVPVTFALGSDSEELELELEEGALTDEEGGARLRPTGQDGPLRTSSLYNPVSRRQGPSHQSVMESSRRKKSLPDIGTMAEEKIMTREEVAVLSHNRREQIRVQEEEAAKLRSNPLLYLFSQDLRDWLSRQQLMVLVLFINISLAIMFFKLLS